MEQINDYSKKMILNKPYVIRMQKNLDIKLLSSELISTFMKDDQKIRILNATLLDH